MIHSEFFMFKKPFLDALETVKKKLEVLSRAMNEIPISIIITDVAGHIEYTNPTCTKISGYSFRELQGNTPRIFKSGKHPESFYQELWNTILSGKEWHGEIINKKKTGELYWADVSISPVLDENGDIMHFVSVREDVTEKKKMIEDLIAAKNRAEESDRLKSAFLANISHEIRTPMNGIMGFAELLKEPEIKYVEKSKYLRIIQKCGERMLNTITNLIEISKIESGISEVHYTKVNVNQQIQYLFHYFLPEAEKAGLALNVSLSLPDEQASMETDREKLNNIFMHLIRNALKYTQKGEIEFGYKKKGSHLEFFVKDTGIGIPPKAQPGIFDHFVQADMSFSKPYEGVGLGLSITRAYIQMLGGDIRLESESGKGSLFLFTHPL
jgi:PAS domain S-box-containing protein